MSQLILRLSAELDSAIDPVDRAELVARIACQYARIGRFDESKQLVAELRAHFRDGQSGRASVWIMLTEGLVQHYGELNPTAIDRISRAQALSIGMKYTDFIALASAWKAHIEFEEGRYAAMARSLALALANVRESDHDAQVRLAIVLSNSFMICADHLEAQRWFIRGHDHAVKNGDQASIEALLYNRAAFGVTALRAQNCVSALSSDDVTRCRANVESAKNLQSLTGIAALTSHIHLWSARLLILEKNYSKAIEDLGKLRSGHPFAAHNFNQQFVDLEVAFCLAMLKNFRDASERCETVDFSAFGTMDLDDQLAAAWMRWRMSVCDSQFGSEMQLMTEVSRLAAALSEQNSMLLASLRALFHTGG